MYEDDNINYKIAKNSMADVYKILLKLAKKHNKSNKHIDKHTKNLTSEKMLKNLIEHGTEFNMSNDSFYDDDDDDEEGDDDLLLLDLGEDDEDFEDEIDL